MAGRPEVGVEYADDEGRPVQVDEVSGGYVYYFRAEDDPVFEDPLFYPDDPFQCSVADFVRMTGLREYGAD